jgi:cation diffusion facilitator family transporter
MAPGEPHAHAGHAHAHGFVDPRLLTTERGVWALKWSLAGLLATALLQVVIVWLSGSVALLADTIHNFGDAATAIPLWIAFRLADRRPTARFTYGYGRVEDLAGMAIVATILFSACVAGYESFRRLLHPQPVEYLWAVAAASLVGFIGNEAVAIFRIKVGKEIGSAALVADGQHARVDGWISLSVLAGATGVWLGYPLADPIVGLLITVAILGIVWESGRAVFTRILEGVEPELVGRIREVAAGVEGVREVTDVRARWVGHWLRAEVNVAVESSLTVSEGHAIAKRTHRALVEALPHLSAVTVHVDPLDESGERHHHGSL